jgi:uncharacterized protein (TIGR02270 family)
VDPPTIQRPIGFRPAEISALVNKQIVSQHSEEAAFLWSLRRRATSAPHYFLKDLVALDERVEAHLDGLRVAGDVGWDFCKENLANESAGEVFALSVLGFGSDKQERMAEAVNAGTVSPKLWSGVVSALGWLDYSTISEKLGKLMDAAAPLHRALGIAAYAIHRQDPGAALTSAIRDSDPILRARALRAAGEIKRDDLRENIRMQLQDDDEGCRFWAAWAITLLGGSEGLPFLMEFVEDNAVFRDRALQLALRTMGLSESRQWLNSLIEKPELARLTVTGTGIIGDPASIPWLIETMNSPITARLAGEAFSMITGVDLAYHDLNQDPPETADDENDGVLDHDSELSWPCSSLISEWWRKNQSRFSFGVRYLAGQPINLKSAKDVLVNGKQRQRTAAALELALRVQSEPLFEVRGRGGWQLKQLAAWTS